MRALVYLWLKTFANGLRRALTSPKRLVGLLAFSAYYVLIFIRPFDRHRSPSEMPLKTQLVFPPLEILDAIVFAGFALLSFILAFGVFGYRAAFKPADVDVLFPTPVSPRLVLIFRIVRDYLLTMLLPLVFLLLGWRVTAVGYEALFVNFPQYGGYVLRAAMVGWILLAMSWVCIGYAGSLFVNRSDLRSDRNKWILGWSVGLLLAFTVGFLFYEARSVQTWEDAMRLAQSPVLRLIFLPATAATALVMAPLEGSLTLGVLGFGGLLGIIVLTLRVALTQVDWMYDQGAARGFASQATREMHQKGDMFGYLAEQARKGKVKAGRAERWLLRLNPRGAKALIWKDFILQVRGMKWMLASMGAFVLVMSLFPGFVMPESGRGVGALFLAMQAMGAFMLGMSVSQSGFLEVLRRVDLQKPLPFTPATTIFYEILAKALPGSLLLIGAALVATAVRWELWPEALAAMVVMPAVLVLICGTSLLMMVLFPDVDDPAQRAFRNLMMLLGIAILVGPGALVFIVLSVAAGPLVAALPVAGLNLALAVAVATVAGSLYAGYNPSE
jgi:hypothetical protein